MRSPSATSSSATDSGRSVGERILLVFRGLEKIVHIFIDFIIGKMIQKIKYAEFCSHKLKSKLLEFIYQLYRVKNVYKVKSAFTNNL